MANFYIKIVCNEANEVVDVFVGEQNSSGVEKSISDPEFLPSKQLLSKLVECLMPETPQSKCCCEKGCDQLKEVVSLRKDEWAARIEEDLLRNML